MRHHALLVALLAIACSPSKSESVGVTSSRAVKTLPEMRVAHRRAVSVLLADGRVLVATGESSGDVTKVAEVYDPKTGLFTDAGTLGVGRDSAFGARLKDGRVLVAGGFDASGVSLSTAELFDPSKSTWTPVASMRQTRGSASGATLGDGTVLVVGGDGTPEPWRASAEVYDASLDSWTPVGNMAAARSRVTAVQLVDGRVYFAGGGGPAPAEVYDPATKTFMVATGEMVSGFAMGATRLADGRVLTAGGGGTSDGSSVTTAQIYDPATNTIVKTTSLPTPRQYFTLTTLPSGQVLVFGGEDTGGLLLFDPISATYSDAGFGTSRRQEHGATLLGDGSVLITGGGSNPGGFAYDLKSADLFYAATTGGDCKSGGECLSGVCAAGKCTAPVDAGPPTPPSTTVTGSFTRCNKSSDCPTGHCVDGVCCDTACTDRCHSCVLPSSPGVCTLEPIGVDLRGECGAQLSCSGTCGPGGTCIGSTAGSLCAASKCTSASTGRGPAVCTAPGASCPTDTSTPFDCSPYTCEPAFGACRVACGASSDCAGGFVCDVDSKTCVAQAAPEGSGGCAMGASSSYGWLALLVACITARGRRRTR